MPIIFASALIFLPITIANVTGNPVLIKLANFIKTGLPVTFAIVIGKKIKADANMMGMTPLHLILRANNFV